MPKGRMSEDFKQALCSASLHTEPEVPMTDRQRADALAEEVLGLSQNTLFLNLRFLDTALSRLVPAPYEDGMLGTDTRHLFYHSPTLLRQFREAPAQITRSLLHTVLHCIFRHPYVGSVRLPLWDLACDIAVESVLRELQLECVDHSMEFRQNAVLHEVSRLVRPLTAEKIYYYYLDKNLSDARIGELRSSFCLDDHSPWYRPVSGSGENDDERGSSGNPPHDAPAPGDVPSGTATESDSAFPEHSPLMSREEALETWKRLSKEIQLNLETFCKSQGDNAGHLLQNLKAVNREHYDYAEFLRKFAVHGEIMHLDADSFDYHFYCYGMQLYGNMPLIEPLEYRDVRRIRDFVIAIDTSGSVHGETVQAFIRKTYNILKTQESFFSRINLHIIQCDAEVQEDARITSQEDFDSYLETMTLRGFGGTDFRPVFDYVDRLIMQKEFTDLRGMLYFTDGYGRFPTRQPPYQTAFIFLDDEVNNYAVPVWAMRVILENKDLEEQNL